jgi:hypothetical protein
MIVVGHPALDTAGGELDSYRMRGYFPLSSFWEHLDIQAD